MKISILLAATITALIAFPVHATSGESNPAILDDITSSNLHVLDADEIDSTRGQYFSSYSAALHYCVLAGCIGPIQRVSRAPWHVTWPNRNAQWRVKSVTGKYLKY